MMFSTNSGSAPDSPIVPSSSNPRIFELSAKSPLELTLGDLHSNVNTATGTINPIITTPSSATPSYMSSHSSDEIDFSGRSTDTMSPSARSALALINTAQGLQQQQQQYPLQQQSNGLASEATLALLSGLVPNTANADALAQTAYGGNRRESNTSSNGTSNPAGAQSPTSQSLQPLTRQTNGARGNVAAFLTKLYKMVGDAGSNNLIKWSDNGQSFLVLNHVEFAKVVLPKFFKHNNFSSFVRQLNMYGFHKVPHLQQGVLLPDADTEQWEFSNPHFQRNQPDLLYLVSRKKATAGNEDKDALTMDLNHILQEVSAIKRHQVAISSDLKNIERDHQSLWQESVAARERHQRQQETIDKILRFLASVFSGEKKRAIVPSKKPRLTITDGDIDEAASSSLDDGMRLVEEEEEEEEEEAENLMSGYKRKRDSNDEGARDTNLSSSGKDALAAAQAKIKQKEQKSTSSTTPKKDATTGGGIPSLPTVSAATSAVPNLPEYLASFPGLNYANPNNVANILNLPGAPFKFDPSTLSFPTTALLPSAVHSQTHQDMLRSITTANSHNNSSSGAGNNLTLSTAPTLASLPPAFAQTQAGSSVTKGVDQITQEMEQLERSIEALRQHGLNVDNFDFDDDTYLSLGNSYDANGYGDLGNSYQDVMAGTDNINDSNYLTASSSASAVPATSAASNHTNTATSVGPNPRITTVDEEEYLEDLLDLDTV
ncbi:stress-responsive transcription factor hsf1 [Mortierella alpina]|nr:stress-responsive transcription factor hsf1 [Mortierella alpina]